MTVEDLLATLNTLVVNRKITDTWHLSFIPNVLDYINTHNTLSTNQAKIILKIAGNFKKQIAAQEKVSVEVIQQYIDNPTYKNKPYASSNIKREVRYLGGDLIAFRFKRDPLVVDVLKTLKNASDLVHRGPKWNSHYKFWIVNVTSSNLEKIFQLINRHKFDFDEPVLEYLTLVHNSKNLRSTVIVDDTDPCMYVNVCNNPILAYLVENVLGGEAL